MWDLSAVFEPYPCIIHVSEESEYYPSGGYWSVCDVAGTEDHVYMANQKLLGLGMFKESSKGYC